MTKVVDPQPVLLDLTERAEPIFPAVGGASGGSGPSNVRTPTNAVVSTLLGQLARPA